MANARMIHRDFFTSADLTDLPAAARLMFAGMIVHADDAGIIRDHQLFFQRTLLSGIRARPSLIRHWLDTLASRRCLDAVILEGIKCWRITNFARFQRLKRREGKRREVEATTEGIAAAANHSEIPKTSEPSVPERLCDEFHFGSHKAIELFERWKYTHGDLNAWLQFEGSGKGTRLRNHLMKSAKNPADVSPFENSDPRQAAFASANQCSLNEKGKFDHLSR